MQVFKTDEFEKKAGKKLSPEQYRGLAGVYEAIARQTLRGKCLVIPWLWEIKLHDKRLYYVKLADTVTFVQVSDKDDQKNAIASLLKQKERLMKGAELRRHG